MQDTSATRLIERLSPGVHFVYVANTFHESRGGTRFIGAEMVVKSGKWVKDIDVLGEPGGFRMELPKASSKVAWVDDETVRYAIVGTPDTHHVTLRFL